MHIFIFFILLISTRFYELYFINVKINFDIISLIISLLLIFITFVKQSSNKIPYKIVKHFIWYYITAVLLSTLVALLDWGQDIITSIIASRFILWLSFGYFLIKFQITYDQLYKALKLFTIGYLLLVYLSYISSTMEQLFRAPPENMEYDKGKIFIGIEFIVLFFYIEFVKILETQNQKLKDIIFLCIILYAIILTDNRTTIFSLLIISTLTFIFSKNIKLIYKIGLSVIIFSTSSILLYDSLSPLFDETINDINEPEYNRIKAFNYFIYEFNKSWYSFFLGNGFASSKNLYGIIIDDLKTNGMYQSDLGLLGQWSMFGLLSIYAVVKNLWVVIKDKTGALFTKLQAIHIIIGFLMFLVLGIQQIVFILIYLYLYELTKNSKLILQK